MDLPQLVLDFDKDLTDAVRRARAFRREAGVGESPVAPEVLVRVHSILRRSSVTDVAEAPERLAS